MLRVRHSTASSLADAHHVIDNKALFLDLTNRGQRWRAGATKGDAVPTKSDEFLARLFFGRTLVR